MARFHTTAMVNGEIQDHSATPHGAQHLAINQLRGTITRSADSANDHISKAHDVSDIKVGRNHGRQLTVKLRIETAQPLEGSAEQENLSAQTKERPGSIHTQGARAQNQHLTGGDAGHTVEQHTTSTVTAHQ